MTIARAVFICWILALAACASEAPAPPPPKPAPAAVAAPAMAEPVASAVPVAEAPPPAIEALPATLSTEQIEKTFKLQQRYFARLYQQRLPAHAGLSGTVSVDFTIKPDGSVDGARLASATAQDPVFEASVVKQVGEMFFPQARQATTVSRFPLNFNAPKARK